MKTYQILQLIDISIYNAATENQKKVLMKARDEIIQEQIEQLTKIELDWLEHFYNEETKTIDRVAALVKYRGEVMPDASILVAKKYIDEECAKFLASKEIK